MSPLAPHSVLAVCRAWSGEYDVRRLEDDGSWAHYVVRRDDLGGVFAGWVLLDGRGREVSRHATKRDALGSL